MAASTGAPAETSNDTTSTAAARPRSPTFPGTGEERVRPVVRPHPGKPGPGKHPADRPLRGWARKPQARPQNVRNEEAVKSGAKAASSVISDAGTPSGSIGGRPVPSKTAAECPPGPADHHGKHAADAQ
jgi:hypothetical protein